MHRHQLSDQDSNLKKFIRAATLLHWLNSCYEANTGEDLAHHFRQPLVNNTIIPIQDIILHFLHQAPNETLSHLIQKIKDFHESSKFTTPDRMAHDGQIILDTCQAIVAAFAEHHDAPYAFFTPEPNQGLRRQFLKALHQAAQTIPAVGKMLREVTITFDFLNQFYHDNLGQHNLDNYFSHPLDPNKAQQIVYFFLRNCSIRFHYQRDERHEFREDLGIQALTSYFQRIFTIRAQLDHNTPDIICSRKIILCIESNILQDAAGQTDFDSLQSYVRFLRDSEETPQSVLRKARTRDNPSEYYTALQQLYYAAKQLNTSPTDDIAPTFSNTNPIYTTIPAEKIAKKTLITCSTMAYALMLVYVYFIWRFLLQSLLDLQSWVGIPIPEQNDDDTPDVTDSALNMALLTTGIALICAMVELYALLSSSMPYNAAHAFLLQAKYIKSWWHILLIDAPIFFTQFLFHTSASLAVARLVDKHVPQEKNVWTILSYTGTLSLGLMHTIIYRSSSTTRASFFDPYITQSIKTEPGLVLQACKNLFGFALTQTLFYMIMVDQSALLLAHHDAAEETHALDFISVIAALTFLGTLLSYAEAIFKQTIPPEYLTLTRDPYTLALAPPIQKSRLLLDLLKKFFTQEFILVAMAAMLIQGEFSEPSLLQFMLIIPIGLLILGHSAYTVYHQHWLNCISAATPATDINFSTQNIQPLTAHPLTPIQQAAQAIDHHIAEQLKKSPQSLPWYKSVASYIATINHLLILPFLITKFNHLLDEPLNIKQMVALAILLGMYLIPQIVISYQKQMHTTADFVKLLRHMAIFKSTVTSDSGDYLPLLSGPSHVIQMEERATHSANNRPLSQHTQNIMQSSVSFFQDLRHHITGNVYDFSYNEWQQVTEIKDETLPRSQSTIL